MALTAGSIPIYLGAPNVDVFMPSSKSYINVRDYKTPQQLANYLKYLNKNNTAYEEYFKWKTDTSILKPEFLSFYEKASRRE